MKKIIAAGLSVVLLLALLTACGSAAGSSSAAAESAPAAPRTGMRIAGLKGPTSMGMVKMMEDAEAGTARHDYQFETYGAADEVNTKLIRGELDIAAVPANVASILYNRTEGKIKVAAINTLGVLYVVTTGDDIHSMEDLRGKTIYTTGKGQTPEFVLNYLLTQNGIDPKTEVDIQFKSEATEVALAINTSSGYPIAVLPQPYATAVQMQNDKVKIALNLTEEWEKVSAEGGLVTGVLVVRTEFLRENEAAFKEFLEDYNASINWVNTNTANAAELIANFGIVEKAAVAEKALPLCNITCIRGDVMRQTLAGYLQVLYQQEAESVGGALPGDDFYLDI